MISKPPLLAALTLSILVLVSGCTSVATTQAQFGHPAAVSHASRTIVLTLRVKYVHVYTGETVAFQTGDKTVTWTFAVDAVGGGRSVDMGAIFPELPQVKGIVVFIERSNLYRAG